MIARFAAALAVLLLAMSAGTRADTARAASLECAWPIVVGAGTPGIALPDSNATYWSTPYVVSKGEEIVVRGRFPNARYLSFNTYDAAGQSFALEGRGSSIADTAIVPDAGSINPWQTTGAPGGNFTVRIRQTDLNAPNTLPLAPAGTRNRSFGWLLIRLYVSTKAGRPAEGLPTLTYQGGRRTRTLRPCPVSIPAPSALLGAGRFEAQTSTALFRFFCGGTCPPDLAFARLGLRVGLFANDDAAYLSAGFRPPGPDRVVIMRAKAPTFAPGSSPSVPTPDTQTRYWSVCNYPVLVPVPVVFNRTPTGPSVGCRRDDEIPLRGGRYTIIVGTEAQRSLIERVPGATFIPMSDGAPKALHVLLLRNVLGTHPEATAAVPTDGKPETARSIMGEYYPETKMCTLAKLQTQGPANCTT